MTAFTLLGRVLDVISEDRYRFAMRPSSIARLDSHATDTLRYIRASMEAAGTVFVPGAAGITMGCVGLVAAALAATAAMRPHWLEVWLVAAAAAAASGGLLMARQAVRQGLTLFGAPIRKFIVCLAPGLFAGAAMTAVLWEAGSLHALPATWLLLYGCALVATSAPTTKVVGVLGISFVVLGLVAYWLPDSLQNLALGAGFGGLHLGFGIVIRQTSRVLQA
jgi:hypothetical protein